MRLFNSLILLFITSSFAVASNAQVFSGKWSGQALYQASTKGVIDVKSHALINLSFIIDPQGRINGEAGDNGCHISGLAMQESYPGVLKIQASLDGCKYKEFNRLYNGQFIFIKKSNTADLKLFSEDRNKDKVIDFNLKANLNHYSK